MNTILLLKNNKTVTEHVKVFASEVRKLKKKKTVLSQNYTQSVSRFAS